MNKFYILLFVVTLCGCAGSPRKDIYFRLRPPTSELPYFHTENNIGFSFQAENQRFVVNPTNNLVTNFNFDNNSVTAPDPGKLQVKGLDATIFYTKNIFSNPFEFDLSLDFAKIKFQLFDFRESNKGFYITGNLGYYITAVYQEQSYCDFFCFEPAKSSSNATIENGITVNASGREYKVGTSIGYYLNQQHAFFTSYNRLDARLSMSATRTSGTPLEIESHDNVGAVSAGIGYLYRFEKNDTVIALTFDNVTMQWKDQSVSRGVTGIRISASIK